MHAGCKRAADHRDDPACAARAAVLATADELLCPITLALPKHPVVAEDGRVYERHAVQRWLDTSRTSPTTNLPMGRTLVDVPHVRNVVDAIVKSGVLPDDVVEECRRGTVVPEERRSGHPMPLFVNGSRVRNLHLFALCVIQDVSDGTIDVEIRLCGPKRWMFCRGPGETSLRRYDTPLTCANQVLGTSTFKRACDELHAGIMDRFPRTTQRLEEILSDRFRWRH